MQYFKTLCFTFSFIFLSLLISSCVKKANKDVVSEASAATKKHHQELIDFLELDKDFTLQQDYLDATQGLIAQEDHVHVLSKDGKTIWNTKDYDFMSGEAPDTVNPSLWRQEKLNNIHGLFKVSEGIYQIRGYDLANMTLIKGQTGWIIVDPLTVQETAERALNFAEKHLGSINVKAIIYTHSHIDHFGGVEGVLTVEEIENKTVPIIAPAGFMEEATSENVLVGAAMGRRAGYMYGFDLARSAQEHVGSGLGKSPSVGTYSLIEPTKLIDQTGQTLTIDGLNFVFQYTPESEAPAEFTFYLPEQKVFCGAELVSRNMHNLYTLRGAKVRDALKWSDYINETKTLFSDMEIYIGSHHWPVWGNERVLTFLTKQADGYKYIHDQSVRMINKGMNAEEIAEAIELPETLAKTFSNRGYYGTLKHNAKAVYQFYMGWYDGNPANLDPLPQSITASRYTRLMGGSEKLLEAAKISFDEGEYRWASELLNHLVFAEPKNQRARNLLAKTYQQLAYQAESGPWRDIYLSGAKELVHGTSENTLDYKLMKKVLDKTPLNYILMAMSTSIKPELAAGKLLTINLSFEDVKQNFIIRVENSVFHFREGPLDDNADASLFLNRSFLIDSIVLKEINLNKILNSGLKVEGNMLKAIEFLRILQSPGDNFTLIEP